MPITNEDERRTLEGRRLRGLIHADGDRRLVDMADGLSDLELCRLRELMDAGICRH